jgi:lambda family phage tail tape measure protein
MADTIGVSRIELTADSTKVESGVNRAKASVKSLADEADKAANRQVTATARQVKSLERQISTLGLSREEVVRLRIAQQSSGEQADKLTAALDRQLNKLKQVNGATREISEGQLRAARAQTPAQIQDFLVQVQGGQNPLTALFQQGSQLQGAYGSVGAAIKGVGASIASIINPLTVSAAALAVVGTAAYQGAGELEGFNRALIASGNSVGLTGEAMAGLAEQFDELQGVTTGAAAEALTQFAATGAFTGDQLQVATEAALQWQVATGTAVEETVKQFVKLSDDPVKALLELDKQMGSLTESQLQAVQALIEAGRQTEAADMAITAYADTLASRSAQIVQNTGYIEKAWRGVKSAVVEAWDALKAVGRDTSATDKLRDQQRELIEAEEALKFARTDRAKAAAKADVDEAKSRIAAMQAVAKVQLLDGSSVTPEVKRARAANAQLREENARAAESSARSSENLQTRLEAVRTALHRKGVTDRAAIDKAVSLETERYNQQQSKKRAPSDGGLGSARIAAVKAEASAEKEAIAQQTQQLKSQYDAREVSANTYYARLRELAQQSADVEITSIQKQIAILGQQTGARVKSGAVAVQIASLEQQALKAREAGASRVKLISDEEATAAKKRTESIQAYRAALEQATQAMRQDFEAMATRVGMGERQFEIESRINDVLREKAKRLRDIALAEQSGKLAPDEAMSNRSAAEDEARKQVEVIREGYRSLDAEQADALNGLSAGLANYAQESANTAGQIQSALSGALTGLEDVFVSFATTGKASFKDLANSIIADLARIAAKQAISGLFGNLLGGGGGGSASALAGIAGFASGGYTGPGGKYEPKGVVHAGEVVWSQVDVARAGGVGTVEAMRLGKQGYSAGGSPGVSSMAPTKQGAPNVNVTIVGGPEDATAESSMNQNGDLDITVFMGRAEKFIAGNIANGRSPVTAALKGRLNVEDRK